MTSGCQGKTIMGNRKYLFMNKRQIMTCYILILVTGNRKIQLKENDEDSNCKH